MSNKDIITPQEAWKKIRLILKPESSFYIISIIYGTGVSILTLAIPISVQSLVNTVTFGVLMQPLVVLSLVLLILLLLSGFLNGLQTYIIELFQRHFYARTTSEIAEKLINAKPRDFIQKNGVELVNRYFDVMTVQKSISTLLTGGVSVILQTLVGLFLLAFYHPYFLVFDLLLIIMLFSVWNLFGKKALETAVIESKSKYNVASWLEELARVNLFYKTENKRFQAMKNSDTYIMNYLDNRKSHFSLVFKQTVLLLAIHALMSSLILGLGGYLVIKGQLTIGQLVAAELVVTVILASFAKSGKYLESLYDLYAAVDKISQLYELESESDESQLLTEFKGNELALDSVTYSHGPYEFNFNYTFQDGKNYLVRSRFYSSKLILLDLLQRITEPKTGYLKIGGVSYESLSSFEIRDMIYVVDRPTVIEGSLLENLKVGNPGLQPHLINEVLKLVELDHIESVFPEGLNTNLLPSGHPLWASQLIRLEIARAILYQPKVIVITEVFDQVELRRREKILNYLMNSPSTVIIFSYKEMLDYQFDKYVLISRDQFKEVEDQETLTAETLKDE